MPYDLTDLAKWAQVPAEAGIRFLTTDPRQVRLEVLSEGPTALFVEPTVSTGKAPKYFIGVFVGYDVVKFQIDGPFRLTASGPGCKVWTPEIENAGAREIPEAVSFTTMMTRRERNPQLELMMHKMSQNMERRIKVLEKDLELKLNPERRIADIEAHLERFRAETNEQSRAIVENPADDDDDESELESTSADAGDGDGLQNRRSQPRRSAVAKKPKS